jgi:hypothetical protein
MRRLIKDWFFPPHAKDYASRLRYLQRREAQRETGLKFEKFPSQFFRSQCFIRNFRKGKAFEH